MLEEKKNEIIEEVKNDVQELTDEELEQVNGGYETYKKGKGADKNAKVIFS